MKLNGMGVKLTPIFCFKNVTVRQITGKDKAQIPGTNEFGKAV